MKTTIQTWTRKSKEAKLNRSKRLNCMIGYKNDSRFQYVIKLKSSLNVFSFSFSVVNK